MTTIDLHGICYLAKCFVDPTAIALTGLGLGCLGEAMGDMVQTPTMDIRDGSVNGRICIIGWETEFIYTFQRGSRKAPVE